MKKLFAMWVVIVLSIILESIAWCFDEIDETPEWFYNEWND